jgi:signal transduction histidine kinase
VKAPRLPAVVQTIRFRLTVLYSTLLFVLAGLVLGTIYLAVSQSTDARPVTKQYEARKYLKQGDGTRVYLGTTPVVQVRDVEQAVNYETLQTMRRYSLGMLGGLFLASLGIGWVLSGRVLRPVSAIARTAEEIQSTDLSRRIQLGGPRDELRYLADTVDSMLARLDAAFQAQRQLIDDASHELRSPLAIIRANVDAVLASPDATEAERRRAVAVVDRATARMTRLVEDLLATARRDADALDDCDVDLAAVVRQAAEEFAPLAADRRLGIRQDLPESLVLIGDRDALRRAVENLLSNAVRLAPEGTDIELAAGHAQEWLWLAVRDAGPGIPDHQQSRVFDRFWRGATDRSGRDRPAGARSHTERHAGLGLSIVRQIVEAHGGQVRLFSAEGEGSTFVLWLPVQGAGVTGIPVPPGNPLPA